MKTTLLLHITVLVIAASVLSACSANAATSLVGDWELISYGSSTHQTPAESNTETSLTFGTDGQLNGNVGCNSFGGDYKVRGDTITFGSIISTMMACTDPIMQQEGTVLRTFTNTATFRLEGSTLTVTSADGQSIVEFERK